LTTQGMSPPRMPVKRCNTGDCLFRPEFWTP
jgi:hypothetical protein